MYTASVAGGGGGGCGGISYQGYVAAYRSNNKMQLSLDR